MLFWCSILSKKLKFTCATPWSPAHCILCSASGTRYPRWTESPPCWPPCSSWTSSHGPWDLGSCPWGGIMEQGTTVMTLSPVMNGPHLCYSAPLRRLSDGKLCLGPGSTPHIAPGTFKVHTHYAKLITQTNSLLSKKQVQRLRLWKFHLSVGPNKVILNC